MRSEIENKWFHSVEMDSHCSNGLKAKSRLCWWYQMEPRNTKLFCCPKSRIHFEKTKETPIGTNYHSSFGELRSVSSRRWYASCGIIWWTFTTKCCFSYSESDNVTFSPFQVDCTNLSGRFADTLENDRAQLPCVAYSATGKHTVTAAPPVFTKNNNHNFPKLIIILLCVSLQPKLDYSYTVRVAVAGCECCSCMRHKCANNDISIDEWETMCASVCRLCVNSLHFIPLFSQNGAAGSKYTCILIEITRFWEYTNIYLLATAVAHTQVDGGTKLEESPRNMVHILFVSHRHK